MLYTGAQMGVRWLTHRPMPLLEDEEDQHVLRHKFPLEHIKAVKNRAGCKFTSALLAVWASRCSRPWDPSGTPFASASSSA